MGPVNYGPGEALGAPWHPHRGFETVTYLLDGRMRHEDSAGNSGEQPGDVQWMTAGRGIIHCEEPQEEFLRTEEHTASRYGQSTFISQNDGAEIQEVPSSESPIVEQDGVWARVIAVRYGTTSSIDTKIPITLIHVKMNAGARLTQQLASGSMEILRIRWRWALENRCQSQSNTAWDNTKQQIQDGELALLSDGDEILIKSESESEFLILAGPN